MKLLREVEAQVNRPFAVKLDETKEVIAHHFDEFGDKVAVAFSGGKDSEVVLYLWRQVNPDVPVVFNNTGVEYPDTVKFVARLADEWDLNLTVTHPEKSFWDCVEQYGFPEGSKRGAGKKANCCYWLKEKPMLLAIREKGWLAYSTGNTAVESWQRMFRAKSHGMCFLYKKWNICKVHPILWWTEEEVWRFIHKEGLPINGAYARGAHRVGCMPCTAYKTWEEEMLKMSPRLYNIIKVRKDNQYVMELTKGRGR